MRNLITRKDSLATHAQNDLPAKTYDFEAPLVEFGDERPSLMKMKCWTYFLNDFGAELAPMATRKPDVTPAGAKDLSVVRVSARTLGASGFLFVNNHVGGFAMAARKGRSARCSRLSRLWGRWGRSKWESLEGSPWPGKCLPQAATDSDWMP